MLQPNIFLLTNPWSASIKHNSLNSSMKCFNQMSTQIAFLTRENNGGVMRFKIFILPRLYYIHKVLVWEKNNNFNINVCLLSQIEMARLSDLNARLSDLFARLSDLFEVFGCCSLCEAPLSTDSVKQLSTLHHFQHHQ